MLRSEEWVASGRMDTVIEEPTTIYIFESKHYAQKYQHTGKEIVAVGISVDCKVKAIGEWVIETMD